MTPANHEAFLKLIATTCLPELGPGPRAGVRSNAALNKELDCFFADHKISSDIHATLRSAALLWHDHLDDSHRLSQELHDPNGSFLHAIMHRREPDYGNAKYWFHRVGSHRAYGEIARNVEALFATCDVSKAWRARLLNAGRWSPDAFVDLCEENAARPHSDPDYVFLQQVQAIEFEALLLTF